jgi:predicted transcriptional regulator of viral defense system
MIDSSKTIPRGRTQLSHVLQDAGDLVSVSDVLTTLGVDRQKATKLLARWHAQGWLKRLRRGIYAPVPLISLGQDQILEDPWVIVPALFGPAYIGGWSAAEHWGLTEQIFRGVCVLTVRPVRGKEQTIQGVPFFLQQIAPRAMFATKGLWRGRVKVEVSNPAKTIIDMLDNPAIGGGIRHVSDCLDTYLKEKKASAKELISVAERFGNGAVFKRLGFLAEQHGGPEELVKSCRTRLTTGNAKLDPSVSMSRRRLVKRWRLWTSPNWVNARPI